MKVILTPQSCRQWEVTIPYSTYDSINISEGKVKQDPKNQTFTQIRLTLKAFPRSKDKTVRPDAVAIAGDELPQAPKAPAEERETEEEKAVEDPLLFENAEAFLLATLFTDKGKVNILSEFA